MKYENKITNVERSNHKSQSNPVEKIWLDCIIIMQKVRISKYIFHPYLFLDTDFSLASNSQIGA